MLYAEHIESSLRHENALLRQELGDIRLDLDDAAKSRRDLQQRLRDTEAQMGYISLDNDNLKVNIGPVRLALNLPACLGQNANVPYCRTETPTL